MSRTVEGMDDVDLGLGFGLKPGSLIMPDDISDPRLQPSQYLKETVDESEKNEFCRAPNGKSQADIVKKSSLVSVLRDNSHFLGKRTGSFFGKRECSCDQEIESLSYELDSTRKQLSSKQQAIRILQQQLKYSHIENEQLESKIKWIYGTLIKDFNSLQFTTERERKVSSESRETLLARIDHLEAENKCLKMVIQEMKTHKDLNHGKDPKHFASHHDLNNDQHLKQVYERFVDCSCFCKEFMECSCSRYAEELLKIINHLNNKIQEFKVTKCITLRDSHPSFGNISVPSVLGVQSSKSLQSTMLKPIKDFITQETISSVNDSTIPSSLPIEFAVLAKAILKNQTSNTCDPVDQHNKLQIENSPKSIFAPHSDMHDIT